MKIGYENLRLYCYSNDRIVKGKIKGICIDFMGQGAELMFDTDTERCIDLANEGIVYIIPYLNPWNYANKEALDTADELISVIMSHYALKNTKICSTGGSMGGLISLVFCVYSHYRDMVVSCVANCPVCDLVYHYDELDRMPRIIYSIFRYADDFEAEIKAHSPLYLVSEMPRIPYRLFHCENDTAVNIEHHTKALYEKLTQNGFDAKLHIVPERTHCDLDEEASRIFEEYLKMYIK